MLSSIHPLGERARNNRWGITVTSFTVGAMTSGAALGAAMGALGAALVKSWDPSQRTLALGVVVGVAGALDLAHLTPPGPRRQVNEHWIGHYRGSIYGAAFGTQLGIGVATFIVTWGVFAVLVAELLTAKPVHGAIVGATFGLGRSLAPLLAGWIDRPSRLTSFHRQMARLGPITRRVTATTASLLGVIAIAGALS